MRLKLILLIIPAVLGTMGMTGCAVGPGTYDANASSYDDSTARNQWEADARMDDWLNQQSVQQQNDMANRMTNAATAAATNAAAAAANP